MESVRPYALMPAPVYVYLRRNGKFLSVKAPMDFFTPEELERYRGYVNFFMPRTVDRVASLREAGRRVRGLLLWDPSDRPVGPDSGRTRMAPAPYELADAIIRIMVPAWKRETRINPFSVTVLVDEICDVLPAELLLKCRDENVARFETALFRSSWMVFLALHLGFCELRFLNRLRERAFLAGFEGANPFVAHAELDELYQLASLSLESDETTVLDASFFDDRPERVSQKLRFRLDRVRAVSNG
ncbi:MAG: hypothetical protein IT285_11980 [Bdellovibrionales bacterium]|nr:hypothetical protein [Bdellovibrionales bacterium]